MNFTSTFAVILRRVIGGQLKQSGHGTIWHDDRTWQDLSAQLIAALSGPIVLVGRVHYDALMRDAMQMRRIRARFEEYQALGREQTAQRIGMKPKEEK